VTADSDKNVTRLARELYKVCESAGYSEFCIALFISKLSEEVNSSRVISTMDCTVNRIFSSSTNHCSFWLSLADILLKPCDCLIIL
jgi:hypothetical protein